MPTKDSVEITEKIKNAINVMERHKNMDMINAIRIYGFILFTPEIKSINYSDFVQLTPLSKTITNERDLGIINNLLAICSQYVDDYVKHTPDLLPNSNYLYNRAASSWLNYDGFQRSFFVKYLNHFDDSKTKMIENMTEGVIIKEIICLILPFEVKNILIAKAEIAFRLNLSIRGIMKYLFPGHIKNDDNYFDEDASDEENIIIDSCINRKTIDGKDLFGYYGEAVYLLTKIFSHDLPNLSSPTDRVFYSRFFYLREVRKEYEEKFNSLFTDNLDPRVLMFILRGAITTMSDPSTRFYEPGRNICFIPECLAFLFMTSVFDQIDYCPNFLFMKQIMLDIKRKNENNQGSHPYVISFIYDMKERLGGLYKYYPFPIRESSPFRFYNQEGYSRYDIRLIPFLNRYGYVFYRYVLRNDYYLIRFLTCEDYRDVVFCDFLDVLDPNVRHQKIFTVNESLLVLVFMELFKIVPLEVG